MRAAGLDGCLPMGKTPLWLANIVTSTNHAGGESVPTPLCGTCATLRARNDVLWLGRFDCGNSKAISVSRGHVPDVLDRAMRVGVRCSACGSSARNAG